MFPPMCLPAAEEKEELDDVLNPQQMEIVTGQYEIRFKSLELYERLRSWAAGKQTDGKNIAGKETAGKEVSQKETSEKKSTGKKSTGKESAAKETISKELAGKKSAK